MGFDLDRLERLAGGLAVLFYILLFLAFITAVMGSGAGGLLLLGLGAVAHVGRVGLEDFVERRRESGDVAPAAAEDAGERATGLRLRWLPSEVRLPRRIDLPRRVDLGGVRRRVKDLGGIRPSGENPGGIPAGGDDLGGTRSSGNGRGGSRSARAGAIAASTGEAAGTALGRVGEILAPVRADARASFAALVAEITVRPARAPRRSVDSPHQGGEDASSVLAYDDGGVDFEDTADEAAFVDSRYEDFEVADDEYEDFAVAVSGNDYEAVADPDSAFGPELVPDSAPEQAERPRRRSAPAPGALTAQERYEARQRARAERGEAEPIVAAVEAAETREPQRVQRRSPGGRPDPLRTRRPTRSF